MKKVENGEAPVVGQHRLYLRRVMHNPDRASTPQMSDEDKRRTIISVQGGKMFGRAPSCDVVFMDKSEVIEREPQYISLEHAKITHFIRDQFEAYFVEDHSENGTYINDRRLAKNVAEVLRVGDTVKFGHKDGLTHRAGEIYENPEADFAFRACLAKAGTDPCHSMVEQMKDVKVKVYIGSPFVEPIDDTVPARRIQEVQQREADSTEGSLENTNSSSSSSPDDNNASSSAPVDASSSTSPIPLVKKVKTEVPEVESTSSFTVVNGSTASTSSDVYSRVRNPMMPSTSNTIVLPRIPKKAPHSVILSDPLNNYIYRTARYSPEYKHAVNEQAVRVANKFPAFKPIIRLLAHFLDIHVAHEKKKSLNEKAEVIDVFCEANEKTLGIDVMVNNRQQLAMILVEEEANTYRMRVLLTEIHDEPARREFERSANSAFAPPKLFYSPDAVVPVTTEEAYINWLRAIKRIPPLGDALLEARLEDERSRLENILMPSQMKVIDVVSELNSLDQKPVEYKNYLQLFTRVIDVIPLGPVIAVTGTPPKAERMEVDEERHSASSGSTAENYRRRTDSEESEIDVVGGGEKEEEEEKEDGTETDNTPTPTPEDMEKEMSKKADPEDYRKSCTPRIDAQSTPSAVVSALPTPMSSPVPKSSIPSTSTATSSAAPVATSSPPTVIVTPSKKAEEEATIAEDLVTQIKGLSTSSSTSEVTPKNKQQKERRMKQLDESSGDSDSDDDAKKDDGTPTQKKKNIRRSTRTAKTAPPTKRAVKTNDQETDVAEESDANATPRGGRRKAVKRPASASVKEKRTPKPKEAKPDEDGGEDPPKKKRGRKKATPPPVEDAEESEEVQAQQDADSEPLDPSKEKCGGLPNGVCISSQYEKKHTLEWVSCSLCDQWFHVYCVRLDNRCFGDQAFVCCGPNPTREATECLSGVVSSKYYKIPKQRRTTPAEMDF